MGYHMGLQHITVLHIDRQGGIWLYFRPELELPWWFGTAFMIPQRAHWA